MTPPQVVLDTNVIVAGLRSRRGAAFQVLSLVGKGQFDINVSVPLVLEYEEVLGRLVSAGLTTQSVVDAVLDYHCQVGHRHEIFFLWRPYLRDPDDDMVLELAVKAECQFVVTFNVRDFAGVDRFGLQPLTPGEFLHRIGVK